MSTVEVHVDAYAKSIEIYSETSDFILENNFFDLNGGTVKDVKIKSVYDIK